MKINNEYASDYIMYSKEPFHQLKRRSRKHYVTFLFIVGVLIWQYQIIKTAYTRCVKCKTEVLELFPNSETIYIITPTFNRPEQLAELTRMAQTLMLVPNIYWLVIEDAETPTATVSSLLQRKALKYEHILAPMPKQYRKDAYKPKGVSNRNRGLQWLREHATEGVLYFADDDNTYDIELFEEMRYTKKVSMWPVGLVANLGVSSPVLKDGKFVKFYDGWLGGRKFPCDMASFAVSVKFLLSRPNATMPYIPSYEEDGFLQSLSPFEPKELEFRAFNCTKILVWHTKSKGYEKTEPIETSKYNNTNMLELKRIIVEEDKKNNLA